MDTDDFSDAISDAESVDWTDFYLQDNEESSITTHDTAARGAVFETMELFEACVSECDQRTLLLAQRVSKTFQAMIKGSSLLQEKLWFKPDSSLLANEQRILVNPLLFNRRHETGAFDQLIKERPLRFIANWKYGRPHLPGRFTVGFGWGEPTEIGNTGPRNQYAISDNHAWGMKIRFTKPCQVRDLYKNSPTSWKDMLLFQGNVFGESGTQLSFVHQAKNPGIDEYFYQRVLDFSAEEYTWKGTPTVRDLMHMLLKRLGGL